MLVCWADTSSWSLHYLNLERIAQSVKSKLKEKGQDPVLCVCMCVCECVCVCCVCGCVVIKCFFCFNSWSLPLSPSLKIIFAKDAHYALRQLASVEYEVVGLDWTQFTLRKLLEVGVPDEGWT